MLIPSKVCTELQRHPNAPRCMSVLYIPDNPPLKPTQGRERSPEDSSERYALLKSIIPCPTATNTSQRENVLVPSLPLQPLPLLTLPPRPFQKSQRRQERSSKRNRRIPKKERRRIQRIREEGAILLTLHVTREQVRESMD